MITPCCIRPARTAGEKEEQNNMDQNMTIIVTGGTTLENMGPGIELKSQGSDTLGTRAAEKLLDAMHDGGATSAKIKKVYFLAPEGTKKPIVPDGQAYKLACVRTDSAKDMKGTIEAILRREHVDILVHAAVTPGYEARYAARSEWFISEILDRQQKTGRLDAESLRRIFEEPSTQFADADSLPDHEKGLMFLMSSVPDPCMEARSISPMTRLIASVRRKNADTGHLFDAADEILQKSGAEAVIADGMDAMAEDKRRFMIVGEDKAMHRTATIGYGYGTCDMAEKIVNILFAAPGTEKSMLPYPKPQEKKTHADTGSTKTDEGPAEDTSRCPLHGYADPSDVFRVSVNIIKEAIEHGDPGLDHYAAVTGGRVRTEMIPSVKLLQDSYDLADRDDVGESFYGCLQSLLGFTLTPDVELEECLEEDPLASMPGNAPATDLEICHEDGNGT